MDQSGDILNALLSDPEKLSAAVSAVSSMLGKGDTPQKKPGFDPGSVKNKSEGAALIMALKPFLSEQRRIKADKAAKMLMLANMAADLKDFL